MGSAISGVHIFTRIFDQFSFDFIESLSATDELLMLTFILFRFFDISKLNPVCYMEKIQGGWGIMLDDVLAGLLTLIILYSVNHYLL